MVGVQTMSLPISGRLHQRNQLFPAVYLIQLETLLRDPNYTTYYLKEAWAESEYTSESEQTEQQELQTAQVQKEADAQNRSKAVIQKKTRMF